jgi:uncharacterized RDD family membrane protein YckC
MLFASMTIEVLRWMFVGAVVVMLIVGNIAPEPTVLGISEQWTNGYYHFAGGTSLAGMAMAMAIFGLYLLLMFSDPNGISEPLPGVFRRFVAFCLDFVLAVMMTVPFVGILPVLSEWKRTGVFQWSFGRTEYVSTDGWLSGIGVALGSVALVIYYAWPLVRGKPSPGACIAGYQIVADEGTRLTPRVALQRTLLGLVAVAFPYISPFVWRDRSKGKFWLDRVCHTRAVKAN